MGKEATAIKETQIIMEVEIMKEASQEAIPKIRVCI